MGDLERVPGSHEAELPDGSKVRRCVYSPHSLRTASATLLLDSGVAIEAMQDFARSQTKSPPHRFTINGGRSVKDAA
jgi:hypothetical protein